MIAEMTIFLRQNFCLEEWHNCEDTVAVHFRPMHEMAMEKYGGKLDKNNQNNSLRFMIPSLICNNEPVCTGETPHPTHPHPTHPPHSTHPHSTHPHPTHPDSLL